MNLSYIFGRLKGPKLTTQSNFRYHIAMISLLCTLPRQRPGTAEGGDRARPGRVLVRYVHFDPHIYGLEIKATF